ncbi:BadM/Rrf2 family transcriptional regulator [Chitinispirillum alkaliphilum]|nr:BadM/Rrf2 family transcriptional regulator [Chitinispirillum alkaliphilum]
MNFISAKTNYGLIAVMELVENYDKSLVQIKDIVSRRNVPKNYLEQILNRLLKSGIVKSVRGNKGGYVLSKSPDSLMLIEVIEVLEGEINLTGNIGYDALKPLVRSIEESMKSVLNISLAELWTKQRKMEQQIVYHI